MTEEFDRAVEQMQSLVYDLQLLARKHADDSIVCNKINSAASAAECIIIDLSFINGRLSK